jgi:Kef-type K+ transport system membrane component KefB
MNLFYQRTYLVLGIFFVFVGAYSACDAGTSYQTTTTVTVIVASIGFILGGIYLLVTYLKNRKILKRVD